MEHAQIHVQSGHKPLLWLSYLLHILIIPGFVGAFINYIEAKNLRDITEHASGEESELANMLWSHHQWLYRTFLLFFLFGMMALGTLYYGFGLFLGIGVLLWWLYRIIRGVIALGEQKTLPVEP